MKPRKPQNGRLKSKETTSEDIEQALKEIENVAMAPLKAVSRRLASHDPIKVLGWGKYQRALTLLNDFVAAVEFSERKSKRPK